MRRVVMNDYLNDDRKTDNQTDTGASGAKNPRNPYIAPRMLSVEPLEAVASACDGGTFGKPSLIPPCSGGS